MRLLCRLMAMTLVAAILGGCDGARTFKIDGELADGSTTNLYVKYYGNGAVQTGVTPARDGKFEAEFPSKEPALVEILDNEYRVLARLYLQNGDKVKVVIDRQNPNNNKVTGNEVNQRWSELMNANAELLASGDSEKINEFLDRYISDNPDDILSTLMFASFYDWSKDPVYADSISNLISPEVRVASVLGWYATQIQRFAVPSAYGRVGKINYRVAESDSSLTFTPAGHKVSLLAVSNENSRRGDSIVPRLKTMGKAYPKKSLQIVDLSLFTDTTSWKFASRRDSADWIQGWLPGGILGEGLNELSIPALPYYIVTDSAGNQKYRGRSITEAESTIKSMLK